MATAFENLAPRVIADLIRDLHLTAEQAAGIVGNGAAESGLLAVNEKRPVVAGSLGGYGWFQWTGPRRRAFDAWASAQGLARDSYAANYGFLLHELATTEAKALRQLRLTKTAKAAAETFEAFYERAGIKNMAARIRFAERALTLYRNSLTEPVPVPSPTPTPPAAPLPEPKPAVETKRGQGLLIAALGLLGGAIAKRWFPGSEDTLTAFLVNYGGEITAAGGVLWSWLGQRTASTPIAGTPLADAVCAARKTATQSTADTQAQSDRADAAEAHPAPPQSLFDLPMSVVLEELPTLLRAIGAVLPEQQRLLEHKPEAATDA